MDSYRENWLYAHTCISLLGGVSLTLRHRLACKIRTVDSVSTTDDSDICQLSPSEYGAPKQFSALYENKDKCPWSREKETSLQMLVSCGVRLLLATRLHSV